eukprot:SAG22_NODE_2080_length_3038_cov_4.365430_1_plen_277_part_10
MEFTQGRPRFTGATLMVNWVDQWFHPIHAGWTPEQGHRPDIRRLYVEDGRVRCTDFICFFYLTDVHEGDGGLCVHPHPVSHRPTPHFPSTSCDPCLLLLLLLLPRKDHSAWITQEQFRVQRSLGGDGSHADVSEPAGRGAGQWPRVLRRRKATCLQASRWWYVCRVYARSAPRSSVFNPSRYPCCPPLLTHCCPPLLTHLSPSLPYSLPLLHLCSCRRPLPTPPAPSPPLPSATLLPYLSLLLPAPLPSIPLPLPPCCLLRLILCLSRSLSSPAMSL